MKPLYAFLLFSLFGLNAEVFGQGENAIALFKREPSKAAPALLELRRKSPIIATALMTLEAEALLLNGEKERALKRAEKVMRRDPRWAPRARWIAARASVKTDCRQALGYLDGVRADPPWLTHEKLMAVRADAHFLCGDTATADTLRREMALKYPHLPEGQNAGLDISWSTQEHLRLARSYEQAREYGHARRHALKAREKGDVLGSQFFLARLELERLRDDFKSAAEAFDAVCNGVHINTEHACYLAAKSRGRQGDVVGALDGYRAYRKRYPTGRFAQDAQFFSAFLLYENGRFKAARQRFQAIKGKWAKAARWYEAWCAYRLKMWREAHQELSLLSQDNPKSRAGRRARYWALRAQENWAPNDAREAAIDLFREQPLDWYGIIVLHRYSDALADGGRLRLPQASVSQGELHGFREQSEEIRLLARLNLTDFARRALEHLSPRLRAANRWPLEAHLANLVGDAERLYIGVMAEHAALFREAPRFDDRWLWTAAYPKGFASIVSKTAQVHDIDEALIYSFIRKESAFDPDALSKAHAVGLMQLLPKTASAIRHQRAGLKGDSAASTSDFNLFDPEVNIELGAWYVSALSRRFKGQLVLVSAAYNAGPRSVISWFRQGGTIDLDIFVESIPFRETRDYVKHMAQNRVVYALLYENKNLAEAIQHVSSTLDLSIRPGVEF